MMSLPNKSEARRKITSELRQEGNFLHNVEAVAENAGVVIVAKDPKHVRDFVPCCKCKAFLQKDDIYRHRCKFESDGGDTGSKCPQKKPSRLQMGKQVLEGAVRNVGGEAAQLLASMKNDNIGLAVKSDALAQDLLDRELEKGQGKREKWKKPTRYRLRLLGRFILQCTGKKADSGGPQPQGYIEARKFSRYCCGK
jgi:hypothetical protein